MTQEINQETKVGNDLDSQSHSAAHTVSKVYLLREQRPIYPFNIGRPLNWFRSRRRTKGYIDFKKRRGRIGKNTYFLFDFEDSSREYVPRSEATRFQSRADVNESITDWTEYLFYKDQMEFAPPDSIEAVEE